MAEFKVPHIIPNTRRTPRSQTNITEVAEDQHTVESSRDGSGKRIERPGEQGVKSAIEEGYHGDYDLKSSACIESQLKEDSEDDGPAQPPQKEDVPALSYATPYWSGEVTEDYTLTVIKNGVEVDRVELKDRPFTLIGRLPSCDVFMEHPSISRYHAVLQYRPASEKDGGSHRAELTSTQEEGFYIYDLGSTHGSWLNKNKLDPRVYYRVRIGQLLKFGGSSRMFVLESPECNQNKVEMEAAQEIRNCTELKERAVEHTAKVESQIAEELKAEREKERDGVMWGMDYDFEMETEATYNMDDIDPEREAYYKDDPKKVLKKYFDREGLDLEYETEDDGQSFNKTFTVKIKLPIETGMGNPLYAEVTSAGKKKEVMAMCALEACRILDANDMLRPSGAGRKRKLKNWEDDDYYDSDDDTFLDRTGAIEKKRQQRMQKAGKMKSKAETFESLKTKFLDYQKEIEDLESLLEQSRKAETVGQLGDSLDSFMKGLDKRMSKSAKYETRQKIHHLRKEEESLLKLINIARPIGTPEFKSTLDLLVKSDRTSTLDRTSSSDHTSSSDRTSSSDCTSSLDDKIKQPSLENTSRGGVGKIHVSTKLRETGKDEADMTTKTHSRGRECEIISEPKPDTTELSEHQKRPPLPSRQKRRVVGPSFVVGPVFPLKSPTTETPDSQDTEEDVKYPKDYVSWLPPEGQSGDGKTNLNEKFGY